MKNEPSALRMLTVRRVKTLSKVLASAFIVAQGPSGGNKVLLMKVFSNQKDITAMLSPQDKSHVMTIASGSDSVIMTFTTEQLLQIAEAIEWHLFKMEDPNTEKLMEALK